MRFDTLHEWRVTPREAMAIQESLRGRIGTIGEVVNPQFIAGVDVSVDRVAKKGTAAVVVLGYPGLDIVETSVVSAPVTFPYVPGLLSFREIPLLLQAFERIKQAPDLVLVDGQGYAHPRRMGIASHLGLILGIPTIGCAKSRLCGTHDEPDAEHGSFTYLYDDEEVIGAVVRTRSGVKPIYVSIGHQINLNQAIYWTLECGEGYRIPEPTRQAHIASKSMEKVPC